jgi:hypothetical protein
MTTLGGTKMADYRFIKIKFWSDPYVMKLAPSGKLLFLYLFTNTQTTQAGLYTVSIKTIVFETGMTEENVAELLQQFEADARIKRDNDIIWVVNFLKHQPNKNPKVLTRIAADLQDAGSSRLVQELLQKYSDLNIPYPYSTDTLSLNKSKVNKNKGKYKDLSSTTKQLEEENSNE